MTAPGQVDSGITSHAFFLADYASVESGKAYVSGGFWNRMSMPEFPASSFFSVVAVIDVPWSAYDTVHGFSISVEDEDANELPARFDGEFQVITAPSMSIGEPTIMPIAAVINGLVFEAPGEFSFILRIDETEADRCPLRVVLVEEPAEPPPAPDPFVPSPMPPQEQW